MMAATLSFALIATGLIFLDATNPGGLELRRAAWFESPEARGPEPFWPKFLSQRHTVGCDEQPFQSAEDTSGRTCCEANSKLASINILRSKRNTNWQKVWLIRAVFCHCNSHTKMALSDEYPMRPILFTFICGCNMEGTGETVSIFFTACSLVTCWSTRVLK